MKRTINALTTGWLPAVGGGALFLGLLLIGWLGGARQGGALAGASFWAAACGWTLFRILHAGRINPHRFYLFALLALGTLLSVVLVRPRPVVEWSPQAAATLGPEGMVCHIALAGTLAQLFWNSVQAWFSPDGASWGFYYLLGLGYLAFTLLLGTGWCAWACGYGAWDEAASRLGAKRPRWRLPGNSRTWLAVSGGVLLAVVLIAWLQREAVFCRWVCPFKLNESLGVTEAGRRIVQIAAFLAVGAVFVLLLPALTGRRTFCLLVCPFGAWQRWVGKVNPFRITCRAEQCTACGACIRACPLGALKTENGRIVGVEAQCTHCGRCLDACPSGALKLTWRTRPSESGHFNARLAFILSAFIVAGTVGMAVWSRAGALLWRVFFHA